MRSVGVRCMFMRVEGQECITSILGYSTPHDVRPVFFSCFEVEREAQSGEWTYNMLP